MVLVAIGVLSQLEEGGAALAAAVAWRQPVASQPQSRSPDVRIGGAREGANDVAFDFDWASGHLFAVVAWGGSDPGWSVNISTDNGCTWAETFFWYPSALIDAAIVDQYLYVAYAPPADTGIVRMRRFFITDGAPDNSYGGVGYHTVANVSPNAVLDISAGANADSTNDRIYCAFIESDHAVRFFWDVAGDGTTWSDHSPAGTSAASGLDYHWGGGTMGSDPNVLWLSYLGTDGDVHVLGGTVMDSWNHYSLSPDSLGPRTRISAHGDTVFVGYAAEGIYAHAAAYHVSYDNGGAWSSGYAYNPPAGEPSCFGVDITARGGWGSAVIFNREGIFDDVYVTTREGYAAAPWNPPETFNELDALSGAPSFIQYLGTLEAFGVVYLAGDIAAAAIPYFDVIGLLPFRNGFESGDTSAWSATVP